MLFDWPQLFAGIGIGLIMSAPAGPVNFLCFHRTLHAGLLAGMMVSLGAVIADGIFATAAVFGVKFVSAFIRDYLDILQVAGGALIIGFGIYLITHKVAKIAAPKGRQKIWRGMMTGFALSITNPGNFFGFMAMFSGLTDVITEQTSMLHGINLVFGVVIGAMLWWLSLTALTSRLRSKITQATLQRINHIAGAIILCAGFLLVGRYAMDFLPKFIGA